MRTGFGLRASGFGPGWIALVAIAFAFASTALAQPKKKKPKPKPTPTEQPAPAPAPAPAPDPVPVPDPAPVPESPSTRAAPPHAPTMNMRRSRTAHGGFVADMDCSACHTEEGWQLAQQAGASGFDHDRTGFALRGAHVQTQCSGCHTGVTKPSTSCEGCHHDPHQGRHSEPCAECHQATAWTDTSTLDQHRRTRMPLTGRHALVDCADCHKRQQERVFSDTPSDCYACHRASYHDPNIHPTHDGTTGHPTFDRNCALCHNTTGWTPATVNPSQIVARTQVPPQHDVSFVLSTGSHRATATECASCHIDVRRPRLVRCDGCHQSAQVRSQHRQPIAMAAQSCLRCHIRGAAR